MQEKQFLVVWLCSLLFLYSAAILWQQYHAVQLQHAIGVMQEYIHVLDQDILVAQQEVAQYKTVSYVTTALAPQEFIPASCHTMMTYT